MISHKKFASRRRFIFLPTYFMLENHAWVNTYLYFFWWSCVFGSFEWMFHRAFCRPNKENMYCNYLNKKKRCSVLYPRKHLLLRRLCPPTPAGQSLGHPDAEGAARCMPFRQAHLSLGGSEERTLPIPSSLPISGRT